MTNLIERLRLGDGTSPDHFLLLEAANALEKSVECMCGICKLGPPAAQPAQEPVAWMFQHEETGRTMCVDAQQVEWGFEKGNHRLKKIAPLYTTPPQRPWVGLTAEEAAECWTTSATQTWKNFEAKLKEKNT